MQPKPMDILYLDAYIEQIHNAVVEAIKDTTTNNKPKVDTFLRVIESHIDPIANEAIRVTQESDEREAYRHIRTNRYVTDILNHLLPLMDDLDVMSDWEEKRENDEARNRLSAKAKKKKGLRGAPIGESANLFDTPEEKVRGLSLEVYEKDSKFWRKLQEKIRTLIQTYTSDLPIEYICEHGGVDIGFLNSGTLLGVIEGKLEKEGTLDSHPHFQFHKLLQDLMLAHADIPGTFDKIEHSAQQLSSSFLIQSAVSINNAQWLLRREAIDRIKRILFGQLNLRDLSKVCEDFHWKNLLKMKINIDNQGDDDGLKAFWLRLAKAHIEEKIKEDGVDELSPEDKDRFQSLLDKYISSLNEKLAKVNIKSNSVDPESLASYISDISRGDQGLYRDVYRENYIPLLRLMNVSLRSCTCYVEGGKSTIKNDFTDLLVDEIKKIMQSPLIEQRKMAWIKRFCVNFMPIVTYAGAFFTTYQLDEIKSLLKFEQTDAAQKAQGKKTFAELFCTTVTQGSKRKFEKNIKMIQIAIESIDPNTGICKQPLEALDDVFRSMFKIGLVDIETFTAGGMNLQIFYTTFGSLLMGRMNNAEDRSMEEGTMALPILYNLFPEAAMFTPDQHNQLIHILTTYVLARGENLYRDLISHKPTEPVSMQEELMDDTAGYLEIVETGGTPEEIVGTADTPQEIVEWAEKTQQQSSIHLSDSDLHGDSTVDESQDNEGREALLSVVRDWEEEASKDSRRLGKRQRGESKPSSDDESPPIRRGVFFTRRPSKSSNTDRKYNEGEPSSKRRNFFRRKRKD